MWWPAILVIPTALTMAIWALANTQSWQAQAIGWPIFAVGAAWAIALRMHGPRVIIRAGAVPILSRFCGGDAHPTTEKELRAAVQDAYVLHGRPPTIVGSGWGFFLYRRGARGPRVFLHRYRGMQENDRLRWKAGTTIMAFTREMKKKGLALETYPTMDYISLGAWFAMGNHGNGGPASGKSSDAMQDARVLDMTTDRVETLAYAEIRKRFDAEQWTPDTPSKYCILDVRFAPLIPNTDVQKKAIIIDSPETCAEWLDPTTYLRVIFQGAARDYAIGIVWKPIYDPEETHRDPHFCSRFCQYAQVDNCSVVCGWHESMPNFTGIVTRFFANQWIPPILPIEMMVVLCAGYRNFELFFRPSRPVDPEYLYKLSRACIDMHHVYGGRSEIRNGQATGLVCLDMALRGNFDAPFRMLKKELGVEQVALHLGKWNNPNELPTTPLRRVAVSEL